ncbi:unnamed protein product [Protopolystoma xenopodis]|uniref:Uncharacterized protein n=1 Tax=Protopolystoma xenopodis TaxID=117903 RepID=A0A448W9R7_9PLAT|nr:unnamed protein product [Protopolystoma xenopodis]
MTSRIISSSASQDKLASDDQDRPFIPSSRPSRSVTVCLETSSLNSAPVLPRPDQSIRAVLGAVKPDTWSLKRDAHVKGYIQSGCASSSLLNCSH